jgi:hypothetical protein
MVAHGGLARQNLVNKNTPIAKNTEIGKKMNKIFKKKQSFL